MTEVTPANASGADSATVFVDLSARERAGRPLFVRVGVIVVIVSALLLAIGSTLKGVAVLVPLIAIKIIWIMRGHLNSLHTRRVQEAVGYAVNKLSGERVWWSVSPRPSLNLKARSFIVTSKNLHDFRCVLDFEKNTVTVSEIEDE